MRILLSVLAAVVMCSSAYALTLDEAVTLALQNDDSIKEQRFLTESQTYSKRSTYSAFLPSAGVSYGYTDSTFYDSASGSIYNRSARQGDFGVSVVYNLFNGFSDWNTYKIAASAEVMQEYQYEANKQDIILAVKTAYLQYLNFRSQLEVSQETLELLEAQRRDAQLTYEVGEFSRADVLKVEVQLASTQLELLNAQINLKLAKQLIERYIGRPISDTEEVVEVPLYTDYNVPDLDYLYDLLEVNRSELQYIKVAYESANYGKDQSLSGFFPKLNASFSYNWYGDESDPFANRSNNYDEAKIFGLTATWNLFQGGYDYNTYLANSRYAMAAAHAIRDTRKQLRLQVSDAYETYFSAWEMLRVAEVGVEQARENYRVTQAQYEYSEATTTDLLDASVALSDAQYSLASARYNIITAVANIERAVETQILGLNYIDPDVDYNPAYYGNM